MKRLTVAVDGPAGSGKSTVAKEVARKLGYIYVDTGAMYRAAALYARGRSVEAGDEEGLKKILDSARIELARDGERLRVLLNGDDVSDAIRTEQASMDASTYSKSPAVRQKMVELQRKMGRDGGVVMEGRDIGTVVFPQADYKFYLDADIEERVKRRALDLKARGCDMPHEELLERVKVRDNQDSSRTIAPLKPAPDAITIDTTEITIEQTVNKILAVISRKA